MFLIVKIVNAHMYVRKMFKISSYISNTNDDVKKSQNNYSNHRKDPYRVLTVIPKWSIFCFHLRSILIGSWVLSKWSVHFLWNLVNKSNRNLTSTDSYGYLHDKPPPCLVDNRIGLQSYVKLKVIYDKVVVIFFY